MRFGRLLRKAARTESDVRAIAGGPNAIARRARNRAVGRIVGRATRRLYK